MPGKPTWLPEMLDVKRPWQVLLMALYSVFHNDFDIGTPSFGGKLIYWDEHILEGPYPEGFWHLITRDEGTHGRVPDYRRAERLPWCAPTILNSTDPGIYV
jgi:hypothetical protein